MFGIAAQNRGSLNGGFVPKSSEHLGKIIGNYWKLIGTIMAFVGHVYGNFIKRICLKAS